MNDFEARRAARIDRLRARAEKRAADGEATVARASQMASIIPCGQPILVGHHSEGRDRRYRAKIESGFRKGFGAISEARDLERRADAAEANDAISSDDPAAVDKLRTKLASIQEQRALAVQINKATRAKDPRAALVALGLQERTIANALTPDFAGRLGVPDFRLRNLSAEARRIEARIADLGRRVAAPAREPEMIGDARIEEGDNRVRVVFPGKPSEAVRAALKGAGFRWSPTVGAWQRQATDDARYQARRIAGLAERSRAAS